MTHHGRETHALLPIANYLEFVASSQTGKNEQVPTDQELAD